MIPTSLLYCNCCGLPITHETEDDCPRCGYPLDTAQEEQLLASSLLSLNRVATYGGATITVAQLIERYRLRLNYLQQSKALRAELSTENPHPIEAPIAAQSSVAQDNVPASFSSKEPSRQAVYSRNTPVPVQGPQPAPLRSFSLASFLEEQTITIVASLGAFLILIGSLSFIATTSNLLLSFLVLFIVHAIFGGIGMLSYRFRSFRTVAAIYTTIFALLVPLVGFSAYRLVSGNVVQFSTPALVAIAALYAALAYGALAVYQKFSPFGYMGAVALMVATLATAAAFNLGYWWWPDVLMLPALPAVLSVPRRPGDLRPFVAPWTIVREPLLALMGISVAVCAVSIPVVFVYAFLFTYGRVLIEARLALVCMTILLLCWNSLFVWRTTRLARTIPYLFLLCALAFAYALSFHQVGYVLVLTGVALLYHGLVRLIPRLVQTFEEIGAHLEGLALVLIALVPFIVVPLLPIYLIDKAYTRELQGLPLTWEIVVELVAIIVGLALTISIALSHIGLQNVPATSSKRWRWLLLLSSFLLNAAYGLFILLLYAEPVWWLLGLSLAMVAAAVVTRRFSGALWANALDGLALIEIGLMLLFSFNLGAGHTLALWLGMAALLYAIVLYQHRAPALVVPVLIAVLILPVLLTRPPVLLVACIILPLAAAGIHRLITQRWNTFFALLPLHKDILWEWPLLVIGVIYGVVFGLHEIAFINTYAVSTVASWLHVQFSISLELAVIALFWYISAVLARVKWWSLMMVGFVAAALLVPGNPFWVLAWLAPLLALLSLGVSRLAGKDWAIPLYCVTLLATVMMGLAGHDQGGAWMLLLVAALVYLIGVVEQSPIGLWVAPIFATWSVFYAGQSGDLYRSPIVALVCAVLGVGIGCLRFVMPAFSAATWKNRLKSYALPLYATACASAVLTGVYGMLAGVDKPFFAAIPTALLVYALVAYGVLLFERSVRWQWLILFFATWGILLLPQAAVCLGTGASGCSAQGSGVLYYLTGIVLVAGIVSSLTGFVSRRIQPSASEAAPIMQRARFRWNWSWYLVTLVALVTLVVWSHSIDALLPANLLSGVLILLIGFTLFLTLLERAPEMLLIPVSLTIWTIALMPWPLWQQMVAFTLLCVLVFAAQFLWHIVRPEVFILSSKRLYQGLSISGLVLIILAIIGQGGLFAAGGLLVPVGVGALFMLAALIFCVGLLDADKAVRRMCNYCAGLLCSLVISWEFSAFGLNQADVLTVAPAVYLVVVAPFLSRAQMLPHRQVWGRLCSIVGAVLLLLPILWISFSEGNLAPTLILAGEALGLLLLGIVTRIRIFVLSGAALTIVGAMHALFLPSLGIPTSLALAIVGVSLLAIATGLSLTRRRLKLVWSEWV
jgi:hypothetical protein